jgi:MOSC domain-containing protein YiiM
MENLRELSQQFVVEGRVEMIVLRPDRRDPAVSVPTVEAVPGYGLVGDRRSQTERTTDAARKREVTLIQAEHIPLIAQWGGLETLSPLDVRRNLMISGINLVAMKSPFPDLRLHCQIGDQVELVITGPCDPCSRMEQELGRGVYNAMRGHGGMTARLVTGGTITVGDRVRCQLVRS